MRTLPTSISLLLALLLAPMAQAATFYVCTGAKGEKVFQDTPCATGGEKRQLDRLEGEAAVKKRMTLAERKAASAGRDWVYIEATDNQSGEPVQMGYVVSSNSVTLAGAGAQKGKFVVRSHPKRGEELMLMVDKAQFECAGASCYAQVAFDAAAPETMPAAGGNSSPNILFIKAGDEFIERLKRTENLTIEAPFFDGRKRLQFHVVGFVL